MSGARTVCFGNDGRELFGWLHPGRPGAELALVICSPFGNEDVFAHRGLRALAEACAAQGMPALRFDADGLGDSAGDELAPDRIGAWVASVHAAVDAARRLSGVRRVCLLGVRFGATLAALAAAGRDDVAALAAIAPVVSGRAFARELRVACVAGNEAASADDTLIDSSNFVLGRDTLDAMGRIDLMHVAHAPAPQMLLIERDDLAGESAWAPKLRSLGVALSCPAVSGYAALLDSQVPHAMIDQVVRWLAGLALAAAPPEPAVAPRDVLVAAPGVHERGVRIDAGVPLAGILATPADWDAGVRAPQRKAVLLLAAGIGRRIGQGRAHVELARRLAAQGHVVLRLDLAGFGDSPPHPGEEANRLYQRAAVDDVIAATRQLCTLAGVAACQVVGHCSGAYNAFRAAVDGAPVAAVIQFNPAIFSLKDRQGALARRAADGAPGVPLPQRKPAGLLRRVWATLHGRPGLRRLALAARRGARAMARQWATLAAQRYRAELRLLTARGVALHFVFGSAGSMESRLRQQGGRLLPSLIRERRVSISEIAGADHIATRWPHRRQMIEILAGLINQAGHEKGAPQGAFGEEELPAAVRRAQRAA